ncbi:MAG: VWA domain-containing protein [Blastocatellia bacterium]|nr:VWA domain-containing protein [Blastocatellia bacterium]
MPNLQYKVILCAAAMALYAAVVSFCANPSTSAQEKQKREAFGSSLKRLKWDEREQRAVETKDGDERPDSGAIIRMETSLAVFEILALDKKGQAVSGLSKDDFIVTEDGAPQEVATLSPGDGSTVPRSIILIIDYSVSQLPFIESSVEAAKTLVDRLKPNDRMAIVTDDVALLTPFTKDKWKLKDGLDSLRKRAKSKRFGRSEQYSALLATLKELLGGVERPIIIFQTDGDELGSLRKSAVSPRYAADEARGAGGEVSALPRDSSKEYSLEDIYIAAEKTRAPIYAVIPGVRFAGVPPEEHIERARRLFGKLFPLQQGYGGWGNQLTPMFEDYLRSRAQATLRQQLALAGVAKLAGGWAEYLEEPGQAAGIYDRIFAGIEKRYILTYYPTNTKRDGTLRRVEIKARNHPDYVIWSKKSYYADSQ